MDSAGQQRIVWWVVVAAGGGALLYWLSPVLTPFLIAFLLAYLANPVVVGLESRRMPRTMAAVVTFLGVFVLLGLIVILAVPLLERQVGVFLDHWPSYLAWMQEVLMPRVQRVIGGAELSIDAESLRTTLLEQWRGLGGMAASVFAYISQSGLAFFGWIANILIIPLVTFYLLRDWEGLWAVLARVPPEAMRSKIVQLVRDCDDVLATFMRGQLSVMLALALVYSVGLWLVGLDLALLIGVVAGVLSFVPYLGVAVGVLMAVIAALMQSHDGWMVGSVVAVFLLGQVLEGFFLTPWLVGDKIGLHPVLVIFAVMAGGELFGFFGVLLALPTAAVAVVLLRHLYGSSRNGSRETLLRSDHPPAG